MKKLHFLTLIICAWVLSPLKIQAQNTYALIVGISQYKEMPALQYADRDAIAFAEFVKDQGTPDQNISLFLNEDATRMNIVDELYRLSRILKPQDRFYFYFGGHGDLEAKIGYENAMLLLHGSYKTGYFQGKEFLQFSELKTWLTALSKTQTQVIFIADACHSGGLIGGKEGVSKTQKALQESWGNVTKILSCKADEYSLEGKQWGGGRGLFSYHLVNGLTGRADANKDKKISLGELKNYLQTNVLLEANPNVQTPVILGGNEAQFLSNVSKAGLAQLDDYEKRNFPIITEVNIKGKHDKMLAELEAKLDTSIVDTYKKLSKALKEKRLAPHDDSVDCALMHYKKLIAYKIPDNLFQLVKRNLTTALLERELDIMKKVREQGAGFLMEVVEPKKLPSAIANLDEAMNVLGVDHYFTNYLQARKLVLQALLPFKLPGMGMNTQIDASRQASRDHREKSRESLLKGLKLEPSMISTYVILSLTYMTSGKSDSALYYQDKVVELLPNQAIACMNAGYLYAKTKYKDAENRVMPHPKAIEYLERAIQLDSTLIKPYMTLAGLYRGSSLDSGYYDFPKAIYYYEKLLKFYEKPDEELIKFGFNTTLSKDEMFKITPAQDLLSNLMYTYSMLHFLYKHTGNVAESALYLQKIQQKTDFLDSPTTYLSAGLAMYRIYLWTYQDLFLTHALDYFQLALNSANEEFKGAANEEKPYQNMRNREIIKIIGVTHHALRNCVEAEKWLLQALNYPLLNSSNNLKLKNIGSFYMGGLKENRLYSVPEFHSPGVLLYKGFGYWYTIEPNVELFYIKLEQNKPEEAFIWLEKAFQNSAAEFGNDMSGIVFEGAVFETFPDLDKARFKAIKAKYFPPTNPEKK